MADDIASRSARWMATLALGVSLGWSCGGGGGGSGCGGGGCGGGGCENCPLGANYYECATPSTNDWICAVDDFTADQHCAAIGSIVASKTVCSHGGDDTDTKQPPPSDPPPDGADGADEADSTGAPSRAPGGGASKGASAK